MRDLLRNKPSLQEILVHKILTSSLLYDLLSFYYRLLVVFNKIAQKNVDVIKDITFTSINQ